MVRIILALSSLLFSHAALAGGKLTFKAAYDTEGQAKEYTLGAPVYLRAPSSSFAYNAWFGVGIMPSGLDKKDYWKIDQALEVYHQALMFGVGVSHQEPMEVDYDSEKETALYVKSSLTLWE